MSLLIKMNQKMVVSDYQELDEEIFKNESSIEHCNIS